MEPKVEEQVEVIKPNGEAMSDKEAQDFLKKLQAGVLHLPQRR